MPEESNLQYIKSNYFKNTYTPVNNDALYIYAPHNDGALEQNIKYEIKVGKSYDLYKCFLHVTQNQQ